MSEKILISPSIIASDLSRMGEMVKGFDPEIIDLLHMDVMDGHFVPNLTFGPGYISDLKKNTDIPLDIHLMIEQPENTIEDYIKIAPGIIVIHYESTRFPARVLTQIREAGILSGLALNPATPVEAIYDLLPYIDMVLIMSVDPGFYGQSFMKNSIQRIERLSGFAQKEGFNKLLIQVDGGINKENIAGVRHAGARCFVAGSAVFKGGEVNAMAKELKERALGG
ncbi:MAG: ribulose-phosphate 3-epimerase [bacterium]|nr:ribulose-phosphate 3-epimerase [bacterium]